MSLKNPIKFPVKFYSWQDTDAPLLEDVDGCIKTILKACLVNGYGDKEGAGWTMPFEDDYRMIVRRPLRTGNPPDIKIENGVTNGTATHRIVAQDNPTGLDDSNELSATFLHARDSKCGQQWYVLATDFACMLFYEMAENGYTTPGKMAMLYIGSAKKIFDTDNEYHLMNYFSSIRQSGLLLNWGKGIFADSNVGFINQVTGDKYTHPKFLDLNIDEKINGGYLAQPIVIGEKVVLPFMTALTDNIDNNNWGKIMIDGRPFLRCNNRYRYDIHGYGVRVIYTPMDYWEL
ncbi:MAG: hypothetical protein KGV56_05610 [Gammaproteobacteria bacterium]|nr:hypothetical protein [Gammaproteobacteria bacterium]